MTWDCVESLERRRRLRARLAAGEKAYVKINSR
jgi:hypothetical protein